MIDLSVTVWCGSYFHQNHASEEFSVALRPESDRENLDHYSGLAELGVPHKQKYASLIYLKC